MNIQKRAGNFSEAEIELLIDLVAQKKSIIKCKQTDAVSVSKKKKCWQELTLDFNSCSGTVHRDEKVLRKKYDNLKRDLKKRSADERRSLYGTGGGPPSHVEKQLSDERLRNVLHEKQLVGMESIYDNDNLPGCSSQQQEEDNFCEFIEVEEVENATKDVEDIEIVEESKWDSYDPQKLKKPVHISLKTGNRYGKRTSWQTLAAIKAKWIEEKSSAESQNALEEHKKRMAILNLQEEETKYRIEEAKKRIKLVDLEIQKMEERAERNS